MLIFRKKLIPLFIISITSIFQIQCKNARTPKDEFKNIKSELLVGKEIKLNSDTVLYLPYNFKVYDTLGMFNDNTGQTAVTLVNLKTGTIAKKFIFSGDKSNEFDINAISINSVVNNNSKFTVLQLNPPCKIFIYDWASVMLKSDYRPEPFYKPKKFGYRSAFLINDSTLFGEISYSKFDNKLFGIANIKSNKLITGIDLPRIDDNSLDYYYEDPEYYNLLKSLVDIKLRIRPGTTNEFAYFTLNGAMMQIFDIDRDYKFNIKYEKIYYLPSFTVIKTPQFTKAKMASDSKLGFIDVAVTRDNIYALYSGGLPGDVFCDDVFVYNWKGEPISRIKLDKKCRNIAIDENNPKILYGLYGDTNVHIVKYALP